VTALQNKSKTNLHVQSISKWAPANIGPYSQANLINGVIFLAGQIGMDAGSLDLIGDVPHQLQLIKTNFLQVLMEVTQTKDCECLSEMAIRGTLYVTKEGNTSTIISVLQDHDLFTHAF
jgi:enamine deaminase RidA (YjgF/YER057c/UK114 family)